MYNPKITIMKKFKSLVLAVMGLLCCMSVSAHDFEVDGIYYNITSQADKTVAVTFRGDYYDSYSDEYSGEVRIPESVTYNGNTYSVTSIGYEAFYWCTSLTSVEIPNSVTSIGECAFYGCDGLTSVEMGNSVTSIGDYAFWNCSSLTSVEMGNSVTSIGDYAFQSCSSLTSVEIPNSVTSIGDDAFFGCSRLTSVELGKSVETIGQEAFSYCVNLKKLISYAEVPPVCGSRVFYGVKTQECTLQVPEKSISAYQQADQWKEFFLIEGVPTAIGGVTVDGAVPATADVYSTNGMLVKRNADLKSLKHELPAGIYIIGGKKVYVR